MRPEDAYPLLTEEVIEIASKEFAETEAVMFGSACKWENLADLEKNCLRQAVFRALRAAMDFWNGDKSNVLPLPVRTGPSPTLPEPASVIPFPK